MDSVSPEVLAGIAMELSNLENDVLEVGETCRIHGLTSDSGMALNHRKVEVMGFDEASERYKVRIHPSDTPGKWKKLKRGNLSTAIPLVETPNNVTVSDGTVYVARGRQEVTIFAAADSWTPVGHLQPYELSRHIFNHSYNGSVPPVSTIEVVASGPPVESEGYLMVPIKAGLSFASGAVDFESVQPKIMWHEAANSERHPRLKDEEFFAMAHLGDVEAQAICAEICWNQKNDQEAFEWWHKAAGRGSVRAQIALGGQYAPSGINQTNCLTKNLDVAIKWYRKAAVRNPGNVALDMLAQVEAANRVTTDPSFRKTWWRLLHEAAFLSKGVGRMCKQLEVVINAAYTAKDHQEWIQESEQVSADMMLRECEEEGWFSHDFEVGDVVRIRNWNSRSEFNDQEGTLIEFVVNAGVWKVAVMDWISKVPLEVEPVNLKLACSTNPTLLANNIQRVTLRVQASIHRIADTDYPNEVINALKESTELGDCVVCLESKALFVSKNCGHLVSCRSCRRRLVHEKMITLGVSSGTNKDRREINAQQLRGISVSCPVCRQEGLLVDHAKFSGVVFNP